MCFLHLDVNRSLWMQLEFEMHLEIANSQRIHQDCCSDLLFVSQSSQSLTAVLESSIVIVEGVTSALIDKGEKILPEGTLSSL